MTTSKYEESIKELGSTDDGKRLKALRFIKNSVIGNRTKKDLYIRLGVVKKLVDYLTLPDESDSDYAFKIQAVTILGSIAYGNEENVVAIESAGAIGPLLDSLSLPKDRPVLEAIFLKRKLLEASTRALKAIYQSPKVWKDDVYAEKHISDIVKLLTVSSTYLLQHKGDVSSDVSLSIIAEFSAAIIMSSCNTPEQQTFLQAAQVVKPLVNMLHSGYIKAQEAAMDALATLCRDNCDLARDITCSKSDDATESTTDILIDFINNSKCPNVQLLAATCLTNLYRAGAFAEPSKIILPVLVNLLKEQSGDIQWRAPLVLADLIKDSEDMQKAAFETDAIPRLAELLTSVSTMNEQDDPNDQLGIPGIGSMATRQEKTKENTLIALAAITLLVEECRTQAIKSKILPHVVSALQCKQPKVRLAACQCTLSLSRSVCQLRTSLVDAGVAAPLIKLLHDESRVVQAAACGALCNLVLDFSPMKETVIDAGAIDRFVLFIRSKEPKLRLNGIWALDNVVFKAELEAKRVVMRALTYDTLLELLHDDNLKVQEQALETVRNLGTGEKEDIDEVISGIGKEDLLDVLESKLKMTFSTAMEGEQQMTEQAILKTTLYIIVNLSSCHDEPRELLTSRQAIVDSVIRHLSNEDASIREAAVWCIINWTWCKSFEERDALVRRVQSLRALGVLEKIEDMKKDPDRDVRNRVQSLIDQIAGGPSPESSQ